jgi:hypothetical protein
VGMPSSTLRVGRMDAESPGRHSHGEPWERVKMTDRPMDPNDAVRMIKRRAKAIDLPETICNHTL